MRLAASIARAHMGATGGNPAVGCVIAHEDVILAAAATAIGGRPHAETQAIAQAGDTHGATFYVTLEPCAHQGKTPPCVDAVITAKPRRVVIGLTDPDPRTNGKSIEKLRAQGIDVSVGLLQEKITRDLSGFFSTTMKKRPHVTLKLALSADGKTGMPGARTKITSPVADRFTHMLRATHDAIAIGARTAEIDKPLLTCRIAGLEDRSPQRLILNRENLEALPEFLTSLKDTTRLLVEGGAKTAQIFLTAGLVDEIYLLESPDKLGPEAQDAGLDLSGFSQVDSFTLDRDTIRHFRR